MPLAPDSGVSAANGSIEPNSEVSSSSLAARSTVLTSALVGSSERQSLSPANIVNDVVQAL